MNALSPLDQERLDELLGGVALDVTAFRGVLTEGRQRLDEAFDRGESVADLVASRGALVDQVLRRIWSILFPPDADAALVAVGGYGRGEMHPGSDVDIMILVEETHLEPLKDPIERLVQFLFDLRLDIGHSVRTLDDCVRESRRDVTVITNLMEARFLAGAETLFETMRQALDPPALWPSDLFFEAKWEEQQRRWEKFGDTAYRLEPNVKESPGGLRDIQTIVWVCMRHFHTRTLHELVEREFINEDEYQTLIEGQQLLWRIRYALHRLAGRREDRLLFDFQRTLADQFGYQDLEHDLAVEQFMQVYYRTVTELSRLNEMLLQLFQEIIILKSRLTPPIRINLRFQSHSGYLETVDERVFRRYPTAMLELFHLLETHPELKGVRASTIRQIRAHRHLIDDRVRRDIRARSLFMEILRAPTGVTQAVRRMNSYGVLAAYLPIFANIVGRMQYDLFHVYTVDAHTLFVLRNLRRFLNPEHDHEFPLASSIIHTIPKIELLLLAGLFHDIAKGRRGDHSRLGAQDARTFCRQHDLSEFDTNLVTWLVEKHLLLSMTAQRQDLSDPQVIQRFAAEVGDTIRLDYLYLLTLADVRATDPARWNSWKDSIFAELYHASRKALMRGLDNPQAQHELVREKRVEARRLLELESIDPDQGERVWSHYSQDFFLHNSTQEIAAQTRFILETQDRDLPKVRVLPKTNRGCTAILLLSRDQENLFARSSALLDQLNLNILDARIMTSDESKAMNFYQVLEHDGTPVSYSGRRREIVKVMERGIRQPTPELPRVNRRLTRVAKLFATQTLIDFLADDTNNRTILRLVTGDRPGLLADIGSAFSSCRIRLHNAKIATVGTAVEDIFFITNQDEQPVKDPKQLECLRHTLMQRIQNGSQAPD